MTMIDLRDAVALSIWPGVSQRRLAAALRGRGARLAEPATPAGQWPVPRAAADCREPDARPLALEGPRLEAVLRQVGRRAHVPGEARKMRDEAERLLLQARARGIEPVAWGDSRYPAALAAILDPPLVLWIRGAPEALHRPSVAIVGSRAATPYAVAVAERLGGDLGDRGVTVVSGLARGVDSAAHRGALAAQGETIAVFGSGPDVIYPPEHRELADSIAGHGALVSELPPGTPPRPHHFPRRNRLISGLSLAVVVVEASERSGSLVTADCALEQGREVMAVPGNVLSGRNRGSHALLKDGAKIVETADDILEGLKLDAPQRRGFGGGPREDNPLLQAMVPGEAYDLDELTALAGIDGVRLLARLLELELHGSVARTGGGRFVRSVRTC